MFKNIKVRPIHIFYVFEIILGVLIIADFDFISSATSNYLRYVAVIVASVFAILISYNKQIGKRWIILLSYLFILVADYFLIFHDGNTLSNIGIYSFILAQVCYQFYINKTKYVPLIFCFSGLILLIVYLVLVLTGRNSQFDMSQTLPAVFYYSAQIYNLMTILVVSKKHRKFQDNLPLFSSILALFLCDTCIGLYNLTSAHIFSILTWVFYIPHHILMITFLSKKLVIVKK